MGLEGDLPHILLHELQQKRDSETFRCHSWSLLELPTQGMGCVSWTFYSQGALKASASMS